MKQTIKKLGSLLLVASFVLLMATQAFAAGEPYTITIDNAKAGHTYGLYQVFDGELSDGLLVNVTWGKAFQNEGGSDNTTAITALITALKADTSPIKTQFDSITTESNAQAVAKILQGNDFTDDSTALYRFAEIVAKVINDNNLPHTIENSTFNEAGSTYVFSIPSDQAGYYLIKDKETVDLPDGDAATLYMLQVTSSNSITVSPKSGVPTVEKKVLEDSTLAVGDQLPRDKSNFNDVADWDLYQKGSFRVAADLPDKMWGYDAYTITFHDSYEDGFTILDATGAPIVANTENFTAFKAYYFVDNSGQPDKVEFSKGNPFTASLTVPEGENKGTLTFTCADIKAALIAEGVNEGKVRVIIQYDGRLDEDANIGITQGNRNEVYLEYTNNPYTNQTGFTSKDEVIVFTYTLEGNKTNAADGAALGGAQFILGLDDSADEIAEATKWAVVNENTYEFVRWADTVAEATTLTSADDTGKFTVYGLDTGTYFLREIAAPEGYNKLDYDLKLEMKAYDKDGEHDIYRQKWDSFNVGDAVDELRLNKGTDNVSIDESTDGVVGVTIENEKGNQLPVTGDTNKSIFYLMGAMLASGCGIVLIAKKRMPKDK